MTITRTWQGLVFIASSLDGFIARLDGDIGWLTNPPADPDHTAAGSIGATQPPGYEDFMSTIDHLVMGRGTYEKILTFGSWPYDKSTIVLSTHLHDGDDERITVARSIEETAELLDTRGASSVYVDGGQVIQSFLEHDLIDVITLARAPVLLGQGLPLFGRLSRDVRLSLTGTSTSDTGMTSSRYLVRR